MHPGSSAYLRLCTGFVAAGAMLLAVSAGAADAGVEGGGGTSIVDSGTDAALACMPRLPVSCPCEGGVSGEKVCKADGSGFGACVCDEPPLTPIDPGGC